MLSDIYMNIPGEPNYDPDALDQNSPIQILLSQIKMLLYTVKGSVLGSPDFGYNLEDKLFSFNLNADELKYEITQSIYSNVPDAANFGVAVEVSFFRGTVRDICLIDIFIQDQKLLGIAVK